MLKRAKRFLILVAILVLISSFAGECSRANDNFQPNVNGSNPRHVVCVCVGGLDPDNDWNCRGQTECKVVQ